MRNRSVLKKNQTMTSTAYAAWMGAMLLVAALLAPYAVRTFKDVFLAPASLLAALTPFAAVAAGAAAYGLFRHFVRRNMDWLETQSHELTHSVVAILFGRRIHSLEAKEGEGVVYTSGHSDFGLIPMGLAPYCLPWITVILLAMRPLIADTGLWVFDFILGVTLCFYMVCFWTQTRTNQTDINTYPLSFSYTYIYLSRAIWALLIIVALVPGESIFTSAWAMLKGMWSSAVWYWGLVF